MAGHLVERLTMTRSQLTLPRHTLRFRLTLLYSSLFLLAGASLLAITYLLVDHTTATALFVNGKSGQRIAVRGSPPGSQSALTPQLRAGSPTPAQLQLARQLSAQASAQHTHDLHQLLIQSGIALAIMAIIAIALGWIVAGRVLRPLRTMASATKQISARNLHERLALTGPSDEVKDLADTIDGLLARLETAFDAQRHFVANASHELRTPLGFNRALLEVTLDNADATPDELRATCRELLESGEHQERLVEALLTLATSERGLDHWEPFDLATITQRALAPHHADADRLGLRLAVSLDAAPATGSPDLIERLASNLIDNAIRHNKPHGRVDIRTETRDGHAVLAVANTGTRVPQADVQRLFEPFQRLDSERTAHQPGHGLGLSIVRAIATAHHAGLKIQLPASGGLNIAVHLPTQRASAHPDTSSDLADADQLRRSHSPIQKTRPSPVRHSATTPPARNL
jgi:signal transduction histidine kinase